jgi:transcriptional regulator with XRE-family HTH domain
MKEAVARQRAAGSAPDINSRIAQRVRQLRAERGMTLDGLAAKSSVSRSMLSLVERGESSPTAVVLEKIATGLGMTLAGARPGAIRNPATCAGTFRRRTTHRRCRSWKSCCRPVREWRTKAGLAT